MIQNLFIGISLISWTLLGVLAIKLVLFLYFSTLHFREDRKVFKKLKSKPVVSVIVPAYNEGLVLNNCIKSLLNQTYKNLEILIVDDGGTDNTKEIGESLSKKYKKVSFLAKENGGKATALNYGISFSRGEIIVCIDADSIFAKDTVKHLVKSFEDVSVAAVGGNVKVANRGKFINKHQATEYISGLNLQRRAFAKLNCMQVISGAIGAFRKDALLAIGGYSHDTIVEDMDITVSLAKAGYKTGYNGKAIAYTEAPEKVSDFIKQRYRWVFGGFQVLKKYKDMIFNKKFTRMGIIGLPYFMIFPWIDVFISLLFFVYLALAIFTGNLIGILLFLSFMITIQFIIINYALYMDGEKKHLAFVAVVESFWYNHLISFTTLKAGFNYLKGSEVRWNKLERLGKNLHPEKI